MMTAQMSTTFQMVTKVKIQQGEPMYRINRGRHSSGGAAVVMALAIAAGITLNVSSAQAAAGSTGAVALFVDGNDAAGGTDEAYKKKSVVFDDLKKKKTTRAIRRQRLNADLRKENVVEIRLSETRKYTPTAQQVTVNADGSVEWRGKSDESSCNDAIFIVKDGFVTGMVIDSLRHYFITPLGSDGEHAIVEVDQNAFPAD
jgi:hypothetical protein